MNWTDLNWVAPDLPAPSRAALLAAEQGILTLLGGNRELFGAVEPIFPGGCKTILSSGRTWLRNSNEVSGQHVVGMQAIAEAVAFGEKVGLDRERLLEVLSKTAVIAPAHVGKLASGF